MQNQTKRNRYEELLIDLSENTVVFSLDVLNNHVVQFISAGFKQVFEQPIDEIMDKPWLEHLNWDDESKAIFRNGVEKLIEQELDEHQLTMTFTTVKGHRKLISVLLHGKFDNGKLVAIEGMAEDITEDNWLCYALEKIEKITESHIGLIILCDENTHNIKHYCWSKQTQNNHKGLIEDYPAFENAHIKTAGIWAKSGQIQLPVILNNLAIISKQEQLPRSHKVLKNMISVPVIEHGKIAMIIGVANKPDAYEDFDVEICQFFCK